MGNVLAWAEMRDGAAGKAAKETLAAACELAAALGGEAHVAAAGPPGTEQALGVLAGYGAERIHVAESEALERLQPDLAAAVIERVAGDGYDAILLPASAQGKDLAPRVAARLGVGLATEVTALEARDGGIVVRRPMYAGKAIATMRFTASPAVVTVRANVFAAEERTGAGTIEHVEVPAGEPRVRVTAIELGDRDHVDVADASIVVSGGRGMQDPENWHLLEALVEALGDQATLGASRAVVDAGWRPHGEQVGQTGKTVSPDLYFAVGISGAIQHLAGMRTAKVIVAINRDADAPIFGVADYGVVGDLFEVLPPLTEEIARARGGG